MIINLRLITQLQAATGDEPPRSIDANHKTNDEVFEAGRRSRHAARIVCVSNLGGR